VSLVARWPSVPLGQGGDPFFDGFHIGSHALGDSRAWNSRSMQTGNLQLFAPMHFRAARR
jgi:hypothetical protein